MSAPLVVNTTDGTCWVRRTVTRGGLALYAPMGVCNCPEFVMATMAELAEHGIAGSADVLPMPVGRASQKPRPIAYAAKNTDLLMADAAERSRAAEWPWDMWCRICLIRPTSHRTEAEALEAADRHVKLSHAPQAEVHRLMTVGGLAELERLWARVAELEAERHSTNEALSDAMVERSTDRLTALFATTQALREDEASAVEQLLTVFRASHESIVMGHYTTAAEARKHCETLVRREHDETSKVDLWWVEDEDTVDQAEDGEQELFERVKSAAVAGPGWTHRTGYVVTPVEIASAYDEEADE